MPRILGVDIPKDKKIQASLRYIYGVGPDISRKVLEQANIDAERRARDLSDEEIARITSVIQNNYLTEGDLRREVSQNIKTMIEIGNYRGLRHRKKLPVRGQRTKTNSRTRKGKRPSIGGKTKRK